MQTGLSSTVRLQRAIKNKQTEMHFRSSDRIWKAAREVYLTTGKRGKPDYTYILKAEPQIRDNQLKMLNEKAAEFGYLEVHRQKNSDSTVGPHNQRINACGANLREFSEIEFPFPTPTVFGTRTQREGAKKRSFRIAGYEKTSFGPRVILSHPDLPSMDFGDSVRSHNEYLATYSTIRNVPVRETSRYSNLLLLLARPYLEHIYSEYNYGKAGFREGINKALRRVKDLIIEAGYRPTLKQERSVTSTLEFDQGKVSVDFFDTQYDEARQFYGNSPALWELERLRERGFPISQGLVEPCLIVKDVEYIREKAIQSGQLKGSIMHRRIENLFPTPWNLMDVIINGHEYTSSSKYIIVSELPLDIDSRTGKVDIALFERVVTKDGKKVLYRPALACEIKTRMAHKWYLDADYKTSESRGKKGIPQRVVAKFPLQDRSLEVSEWNAIVDSAPSPNTRKQVAIYADALSKRFQEIAGGGCEYVFKATIMIEAISNINQIRRIIEGLVVKAYEFLKQMKDNVKRTIVTPVNYSDCKIALVIHNQKAPKKPSSGMIEQPWCPPYNPFHPKKETCRRFILYLAGESPTSSGASAAWNAQFNHALRMLHQMKLKNPKAKFLWLDLADQFTIPKIAEARLHLRPRRFTSEEKARAHHEHIRLFFENIEVRGYLDDILTHLYEDSPEPAFEIRKDSSRPLIVIVSGIDILKNTTPETHRNQLQIMLDSLLASLPDNETVSVLWFDSPVPSTEKSIPYATRALIPYYTSSSLAEYTTEIIWNLPSPPRSAVEPEKWTLPSIGDAPIYDDIRLIVKHTPRELDIQFETFPLLQGWSRRFKNQGRGLVFRERSVDNTFPDRDLRDRIKLLALTLIPWIVKLKPKAKMYDDSSYSLEEQLASLIHEFKGFPDDLVVSIEPTDQSPRRAPETLDLLRFRPIDTRSGEAYAAMTYGRINSQRLYRSPNKLQTKIRQLESTQETGNEMASVVEKQTEWMLGTKFVSEDTDLPWWMVIQDPKKSSRLLVGCFLNKPLGEGEFQWSETKREIVTIQTVDEILRLPQNLVTCRQTEHGLEVWHIDLDNREKIFMGILKVVRRGHSPVSHLRGIRYAPLSQATAEPLIDTHRSESFNQHVADALNRYRAAIDAPIPVTVHIKRIDDRCSVSITNEENLFQKVELELTSDLVFLLRWPMIQDGPMCTDAGEFVTWDVFNDIEYNDMDFIRPYIVYRATRMVPNELPPRISQFFEIEEELTVEIEHDKSICPIAHREDTNHGACWQISLPAGVSEAVECQLRRNMTGREVHGLLAPGRIWIGKLYGLNVSFDFAAGSPECLVFQEDKWIRKTFRSHGVSLPAIPPGSYLRAGEERWYVEIEIYRDRVSWRATSTLTKKRISPFIESFAIDFRNNIEEECSRILDIVSKHIDISSDKISNVKAVNEYIADKLSAMGFGEENPPCWILIEHSSSELSISIGLGTGMDERIIEKVSYQIKDDITREEFSEVIYWEFDEGWLSQYNITNEEECDEQLNAALDSIKFIDASDAD
jgi:hypothetical protein